MLPRPILRCTDDNHTPEGEVALVRDMLAGRRDAWRAFHGRYDRLVFRCIARTAARFGRRLGNDDIAELHAIFLAQLCADDMRKLRTFDAERGSRFSTWIAMLASNSTYDQMRALRKEGDRATLDEAEDVRADGPTPDQVIEMKEGIAKVGEVLQALSDKDREFVTLYFDEGLDAEQVAARMQISLATVYTKKHKIQTRIEARLAA